MSLPGAVPRFAAAGLLALQPLAAPLPAQVVRGTVVGLADGRPVVSATMLVSRVGRGVNHRSMTDSAGAFKLRPYPRGEYQLSVERNGTRVDVGPPMAITHEDTFTVVVRIPREGSARPELTIVSDTRSPLLESVGYYKRGSTGMGAYIGPALLGARNWLTTSEVVSHSRVRAAARLRTPYTGYAFRAFREFRPYDAFGVYAAGGSLGGSGGGCSMLFVDGIRYGWAYRDLLDRVAPQDIEGIEIYSSYWGTPPEFATKGSHCGAILIWLRG
ncbi:MAG: carboxypeptidase regulatory-like domain-containing protein [Gemmatimonadetes bacterium]|nr:carboxypeptidase regulatory-like domain-containing protein [Gemmatimonadota bacterium]